MGYHIMLQSWNIYYNICNLYYITVITIKKYETHFPIEMEWNTTRRLQAEIVKTCYHRYYEAIIFTATLSYYPGKGRSLYPP